MKSIKENYTILPGEQIELPPSGINFMTSLEIESFPQDERSYPFSFSDDSGVINDLSVKSLRLGDISMIKGFVKNNNKEPIYIMVTAKQAHE